MSALSYVEPSIETILILSSFLLVLNSIDWALNATISSGLIGQILIGIAWGAPGLRLLNDNVQVTVTELGYIGLILIVYQGLSLSVVIQHTTAHAINNYQAASPAPSRPCALASRALVPLQQPAC